MEFSAKGIVIKEVQQGESDKLLTILTAEHGKIYAYAKGVKKISSKNAPACQLFVFSEYEFVKKAGRLIVKTAVSNELFYNMRSDMVKYSLACYFAQIINHVALENNDETETLRLFLNTLYAMANKTDIPLQQIKAVFELKLLCLLGFMPDLSACFSCGCEFEIKRNNIFSFDEAGLVCEECAKKRSLPIPFSCSVSGDVIKAMAYITTAQTSKMLAFKLSDDNLKELSFIAENYLIHKTERTFEALRIYKSIVNSLNTSQGEK